MAGMQKIFFRADVFVLLLCWCSGENGQSALVPHTMGTPPTPPRYNTPGVCFLASFLVTRDVFTGGTFNAGLMHRHTPLPTTTTGRHETRQRQTFIPLSREREVSRARARRALAGGWAVPREIASLAPRPPPPNAPNADSAGDNRGGGRGRKGDGVGGAPSGGGGGNIVAAAAGFSHTVLVTGDGRMYLFGEGAAVAGGDLAALEARGGGVDGGRLREAGGLVRRRPSAEEGGERVDPVTVSRGHEGQRRTGFRVDVEAG